MLSSAKFSEAMIPILMTSAGHDRPFRTDISQRSSTESTIIYHSTASDHLEISSLSHPLQGNEISVDESISASHTTAIHIEIGGDGDLRVWATDES